MKIASVKTSGLLMAILFVFVGYFAYASNHNSTPENLLLPVSKKGKYAKLNVSTLPADQEVTVRIRDYSDRLVEEFKVKNTGQTFVLVNFNRLNPGVYSMNILKNENEVLRKILDIHWDKVVVDNIAILSEERRRETRWPFILN